MVAGIEHREQIQEILRRKKWTGLHNWMWKIRKREDKNKGFSLGDYLGDCLQVT